MCNTLLDHTLEADHPVSIPTGDDFNIAGVTDRSLNYKFAPWEEKLIYVKKLISDTLIRTDVKLSRFLVNRIRSRIGLPIRQPDSLPFCVPWNHFNQSVSRVESRRHSYCLLLACIIRDTCSFECIR